MKVAKETIDNQVESLTFEFHRVPGRLIVACWAFMPDGFQVGYGQAGCVDPDEFDLEQGKDIAKKNAIADATNKLWGFEGYMLKKIGKTSDQ